MKQLVFLAVELYMMIIRTLHSFLFRLIAAAGLLLTSCLTAYADFWEPDSLGEGFERHYAVGPDDYAGKVRCAVVSAVKPGDIILLHDFYPTSVDAALEIVDRLQKEGYDFVTVEELFRIQGVEPQPGTLYARPDRVREVN